MTLSRRQVVLACAAVLVLVATAAAAGGVVGGLAGYAVGQGRELPERVVMYSSGEDAGAPLAYNVPRRGRAVFSDAGPPTVTATPRPRKDIRGWVAELEKRIVALERRVDARPGSMDQLLPLLLTLRTLVDGYDYGLDSRGYPENHGNGD